MLLPLTREASRRMKDEVNGHASYSAEDNAKPSLGDVPRERYVDPALVAQSSERKVTSQSEEILWHLERMYDYLCDYVGIDEAEEHWQEHKNQDYVMPALETLDRLLKEHEISAYTAMQ